MYCSGVPERENVKIYLHNKSMDKTGDTNQFGTRWLLGF